MHPRPAWEPHVDAVGVTATSITLATNVYKLTNTATSAVVWWPCDTTACVYEYGMLAVPLNALSVPATSSQSSLMMTAGPNPGRGHVRVSLSGGRGQKYSLAVFDVQGRRVRELAAGRIGGPCSLEWDGRDKVGRRLAAGVYLITLRTDKVVLTRRVCLVE
jgi:hypothetical protein